MQSMVKIIALWICLCIRQMTWFSGSQGSQLGLVVPDKTTDGLFASMGRARIGKFTVNGETAELDVILEDTVGTKEVWLLDFQPYRYKIATPIDHRTGDLWSSRTGYCSNVEEDRRWEDRYFDDDFFKSKNSSGAKNLFSRYLRGSDENATLGIRLDEVRYAGSLDTFMYCERSDGSNIWDFSIHFEEIQYTTVLYATNVRPVPGWSPGGSIRVPAVAYVQTHIRLVWRLTRIAMVNFVVSSVPIISERLLEEIGRLLVLFDFAIVEPYLLSDGVPDLSRARLHMGFSTLLPARNRSIVVFRNGTEIYEPEVQGNSLEEVVSAPPSTLEETPICSLRRPQYCQQTWEFEMVLRMDLATLVQELPLDATGVFQFNFDSYKCPDLNTTEACELASDLPPWDVRIDLTLQTTVDAVDEQTDSVTLSIVKLANDKGEDLRGGRTINHMENITVEVRFSPAFLRSSYILELQLFMVCIGDQHLDSSQGCLGAREEDRYSAFVGQDLYFTYDPAEAPEYAAMLQPTDTPPEDGVEGSSKTAVPPTTVPQTYIGVAVDSVFIRPYPDSTLRRSLGSPVSSLHFLKEDIGDGSLSPLYMIELLSSASPPILQPTIIVDSSAFQLYFAWRLDQYRVLETVLAGTDAGSDGNLQQVYSAFTSESPVVSYVGTDNPAKLHCEDFDTEQHHWYYYEPDWVDLASPSCQFLMDLVSLRNLVQEIASASLQPLPRAEGPLSDYQEPTLSWNASSRHDVYLLSDRDLLLNILHLEPSYVDKLVEFEKASDWQRVDLGLYSILLFQEEDILLAFEPSGFLSNLRDRVQYFADRVNSFSDYVIEAVDQQSKNDEVQLAAILEVVSELTRNESEYFETFSSESSDSLDEGYWLGVAIDDSFYRFLWSICSLGRGSFQGNFYKTESRNPEITLDPIMCRDGRFLAGYSEHCQMNWAEVIPFWVYPAPLVTAQEALPGGWGFWSDWSECSQSCGGGVRTRHRECIDMQRGCSGLDSVTDSCNKDGCSLFDSEGFRLVLKAARHSGISIYDFWVSSDFTADSEIHSSLYKSSLVEEWADTITVKEVKVSMLYQDQPVLELIFNGQESNKMDWFRAHRLISSPYNDVSSSSKNFFSIDGHASLGRRFFISHWYRGCRHQLGWMVVLDAGSRFHPCSWEKHLSYPAFYYSKISTKTNFRRGQIGIADEFAIYIKYTKSAYIPPPPTLPPPVTYTREMISSPPPGSQLRLEEYDLEKQVHRSQLQNTVLSQERNAYTMTTIYTLVSIDEERTRRDGHRARRTLIASTQIPQLQSARFISEGCPPGSEFNPIDLTCDCLQSDWFYSEESFHCEPRNTIEDPEMDVVENTVTPDNGNTSSSPTGHLLSVVLATAAVLIIGHRWQ
ncbi:uncharacterized protein LOC110981300 isoform X2 [Acanthaster planci]|uniref:Uncharacterized protein LOC110981300 isoform X2 n=1 Tax=Acanthaster planci TaxID=133434 RepID=A0A8B7YMI4_ACAPL|nr:uncharacterized protein LOC110981300 isoform X2 [Acanthaster planci]